MSLSLGKRTTHRGARVARWAALAAALFATYAGQVATTARAQSAPQSVDIDAIFWCRAASPDGVTVEQCAATRMLILATCTSCHTFVPLVKARKTAPEWNATLEVHRSRMPDVTDEQYAQIRAYLVSHFNPDMPVPKLPPELERLGSQQAG